MALSHNQPDGHHPEPTPRTSPEITEDLVSRVYVKSSRYWTAVLVLGVLFLLGVIGFIIRAAGGFGNHVAWAYYAAFFPYMLATALAAPIVAWMTRAAKGVWGRTLRRPAELTAAAGIIAILWFIPMLIVLPPFVNAQGAMRNNIWMFWPLTRVYDLLAVLCTALLGLAILYIGALPDIAAARDRAPAGRAGLFRWLARGWRGTTRQWYAVQHGIAVLGAMYLAFWTYTVYIVAVEFAESLIPGWYSASFPGYSAVTGLEGAVATVMVVMGLLRWIGGYDDYLGLDQFWSLAKIQLALGLFWFYWFWSEFIILWYGRTPREQMVAEVVNFGPYLGAFVITVIGCFLVPFLSLIWNKVRVSVAGPFVVSIFVLIGLYFDRVRTYAAGFSIANPFMPVLDVVPPTHYPDLADILITIGGLASVPLLVLLALRVVPAISVWEVKEALVLRVVRPYLHARVRVIGKPR